MSVAGEFERLLEAVRAALRDAEPAGGEAWLRELDAVPRPPSADLSRAAREALRACEESPARARLVFEREGEKERFEAAFERLVGVCRAILGA